MGYIVKVLMKFDSQRDWERFQRDALEPSIRLPVQPVWYDIMYEEDINTEGEE